MADAILDYRKNGARLSSLSQVAKVGKRLKKAEQYIRF
jgi:hypothetical protein